MTDTTQELVNDARAWIATQDKESKGRHLAEILTDALERATDLAAHDRQLMVDVLNEAADDLGDTNLDTIWESVAFLRDRATAVTATHTDDGTAHIKPARRITPAAFNMAAGHFRAAAPSMSALVHGRDADALNKGMRAALASLGIEVDHA